MIFPFSSYAGSKRRMLGWIYKHFPRRANVYVEPFAGTGVVCMFKPTETELDVLNDVNTEMINMLKCIRDDTDRFVEYLLFTPIYSEDYNEYKALSMSSDRFVSAVNYFLFLATSAPFIKRRSKFLSSWIRRKYNTNVRMNKDYLVGAVREMALRLKNALFLNLDYKKVIKMYDFKKAFFYLDPPYPNSIVGVDDKTTGFDFDELLDIVLGIEGDFLLSLGYSNANDKAREIVMKFADRFEVVDKIVRTSTVSMFKREFTEYLFAKKLVSVYAKPLF